MTMPCPISTGQEVTAVESRKPQVCSKPATILLVDDDEAVREFVRFALATSGYKVVVCATGEDALRQESQYAGVIDLMLTDLTMPGMSGIDTANALALRRPDTKIVLMSGCPPEGGLRPAMVHAFILKPFTAATLLLRVRGVLQPIRDAHPA